MPERVGMKRGLGWFFMIVLSVALMACGSEDVSESANASDPTDVRLKWTLTI